VSGGARGILSIPALRAIDQTFKNPPDCLLTRQGSFQANSLSADVTVGPQGDIDVFVLPSMGDGPAPILASGTVAAAFNDSAETIALMEFLASPEAGEAWAAVGGYNSPHLNFDPTAHATGLGARLADLIQQAEVVRFDGSDLMPPSVGTGTFWEGMIDYVAGTPLDAVLENIQAGYSTDSR
jgi:alpha-glucoside transport system substrate-binding protein